MTRFAISLGSNLGDRVTHLRGALYDLDEYVSLEAVSSLFETVPVGHPEQDPFLNAVAVAEADMGAHALLGLLHQIEGAHGRTREIRWGPRTLDLDLIASDGEPIDDPPDLILPHPRAGERRFVLEPLSEIWPEAPIGNGAIAKDNLEAVRDQEVDRLERSWLEGGTRRGAFLVAAQVVVLGIIGAAWVWQGSLTPLWPAPWRMLGAILAMLGLILMAWGARSLGRNLTALPEPVTGGKLVTTGPYRWVRHPLYTAVVLLFFGISLFLAAAVAAGLSLLLFAFFGLKSGYEERQLRIAYPAYSSYRARVRSRFLPFI